MIEPGESAHGAGAVSDSNRRDRGTAHGHERTRAAPSPAFRRPSLRLVAIADVGRR